MADREFTRQDQYLSEGGGVTDRVVVVDSRGFVIDYPNAWSRAAPRTPRAQTLRAGRRLARCHRAIPWKELPARRLGLTIRQVLAIETERSETKLSPDELFEKYVALWNEPDAERRRARVIELWAPGARQVLKPPVAVAEVASGLGMTATLEARGHDQLESRVTRAYEEFVASGGHEFRRRGEAERLEDVVKFRWEMGPIGGGAVAGVGLEILMLDPDGRIRAAYQFIEG